MGTPCLSTPSCLVSSLLAAVWSKNRAVGQDAARPDEHSNRPSMLASTGLPPGCNRFLCPVPGSTEASEVADALESNLMRPAQELR
jgi:hypothetical protein